MCIRDSIKGVREYCIKYQKPYLIECMTFRMRGHEEASGTKYIPQELFGVWKERDPVVNFENYLIDAEILTHEANEAIKSELKEYIEAELNAGFATTPMIIN